MHPLYLNRNIVLPYGDAETQGKIDAFINEHKNYDPDRPQTGKWRNDRVAAAWFAQMYIDSLQGGRMTATVDDTMPKWLSTSGAGWSTEDVSGGWL